jgi:oligopeptide transport system permease protein
MSKRAFSPLNLPVLAGLAIIAACFLPFGVMGASPNLIALPGAVQEVLAPANSGLVSALPWLLYAIPALGGVLIALGLIGQLPTRRQIGIAAAGLFVTLATIWLTFQVTAHSAMVPDRDAIEAQVRADLLPAAIEKVRASKPQASEDEIAAAASTSIQGPVTLQTQQRLRAGIAAHKALVDSPLYKGIAPWGWGRWIIFGAFAAVFFLAGARDNSTAGYLVRRLAGAIPTLLIIIIVTFLMMRLAPGGPFDGERPVSPEIRKNLEAAYDLDKPVHEQLFIYVGRVLEGDFGPSYKTSQFTVGQMIGNGAPVSATLGVASVALAAFFGTMLGIFAALRQNTTSDYSVMSVAMIGITVPTFVTAPILQLLFGVYAGWLPVQGNIDTIRGWIMPVTVLALPQIAIIARLVRGSMIEVLRSNYVRTARAKGLSETRIVMAHVLRAGLLPLISYLGPAIAGLMTGSLVVEQIFGLPGIGRFFVRGAFDRDYTLVMGVVILYSMLILLFNMLTDVLYRVLDPKVRLG